MCYKLHYSVFQLTGVSRLIIIIIIILKPDYFLHLSANPVESFGTLKVSICGFNIHRQLGLLLLNVLMRVIGTVL
jgi:hypothetical protein